MDFAEDKHSRGGGQKAYFPASRENPTFVITPSKL
jgi:hypothetical protein